MGGTSDITPLHYHVGSIPGAACDICNYLWSRNLGFPNLIACVKGVGKSGDVGVINDSSWLEKSVRA